MTTLFELPVPSPDEQASSLRLAERVIARCEQVGGVIGFDEYMATVLYDPQGGYYGAGHVRFGEGGDFVTAPERSPFFSVALGNEIAGLFEQGVPAHITEFGAGSGRLAIDLLRELASREVLPACYRIVELSPALRARQQAALKAALPAEWFERVEWLDEETLLAEGGLDGVVLGNELLDAMPVHRLQRDEQGALMELGVGWNERRFEWRLIPADDPVQAAVQALERRAGRRLDAGQIVEVNLQMNAWLERLAAASGPAGLALILFDYGASSAELIRPDRREGTLRCHYRQLAHDDPFVYPGLQDITAWVDFSALAQAAETTGMSPDVYQSQAAFILNSDAPARLESQMRECSDRQTLSRLAQGFKELVMPTEMGDRFRALLVSFRRELHWRSASGRNELPRL